MKELITGAFKEAFEEYVVGTYDNEIFDSKEDILSHFYGCGASMMWGVIQDFADSVGILSKIECWFTDVDYFHFFFEITYERGIKHFTSKEIHNTRPGARRAAVKKLVEIYNDRASHLSPNQMFP